MPFERMIAASFPPRLAHPATSETDASVGDSGAYVPVVFRFESWRTRRLFDIVDGNAVRAMGKGFDMLAPRV
jgi:hypothetical protein